MKNLQEKAEDFINNKLGECSGDIPPRRSDRIKEKIIEVIREELLDDVVLSKEFWQDFWTEKAKRTKELEEGLQKTLEYIRIIRSPGCPTFLLDIEKKLEALVE